MNVNSLMLINRLIQFFQKQHNNAILIAHKRVIVVVIGKLSIYKSGIYPCAAENESHIILNENNYHFYKFNWRFDFWLFNKFMAVGGEPMADHAG
jgi:hypothetical protein